MEKLNVCVTKRHVEKLNKIRDSTGMAKSEVIRRALDGYFKKNPLKDERKISRQFLDEMTKISELLSEKKVQDYLVSLENRVKKLQETTTMSLDGCIQKVIEELREENE